ncbi:unnamed protein product [Pleuronectes platessa]|uniref:Uncharacterized protein n=1 Tax=Pleuronectes platessa TaxID=8262 RepID=A0A9N7UBD6_PLEPL|nr:unnamed protein product [Pleuronectes platessa]
MPPPFVLPESSVLRSARKSWKPASCSAESGTDPHSHVSVKHSTEDEEKSLFLLSSSWSSSSLLHSERTLERNIPGSAVQSPRWRRRTRAPALFTSPPPLHRLNKGLPPDGDVEEMKRVWQNAKDYSPKPMTVMAALFHCPEEVEKMDLRLKVSREEKNLALFLVKHRRELCKSKDEPQSLKPFTDFIFDSRELDAQIKVCELLTYQGEEKLLAELRRWSIPRFPVSGHDLRRMGITSGKEIGATLQNLRDIWKKSRYQMDKEELLSHVQT